jgi:hypothetical protein
MNDKKNTPLGLDDVIHYNNAEEEIRSTNIDKTSSHILRQIIIYNQLMDRSAYALEKDMLFLA